MTVPNKGPITFTRNQAKLLGVISWLPISWLALAVLVLLTIEPAGMMRELIFHPALLALLSIITFALIIYYCVLISRVHILTSNQKYNWGWFVFLLHVFAFPKIWHKFIWKKVTRPGEYYAEKTGRQPMTFTRNQAILLGIASLLPCCGVLLFYGALLFAGRSEPAPGIMPGLTVATLTLPYIYTPALIIFYIVLISRETDLTSNRKYSWGWIILFANVMALPLVWYKFVWSKLDQPDSPPALETPVDPGRKKAIWLGVVSSAPIGMIILGIGVMVLAGQAVRSPEVKISIILSILIVIGIISISLTVYFCILISKDQELTSEQKLNGYWAIFLLNFWAFPWVWFKFVWRKSKEPVDDRAVEFISANGREDDLSV